MLETNFISAVPLNLTFRSAFFVYQHIRRSLNDCGSRQSILKFRTALESPFHFQCNTAIPPPAALCENMIENVLLFLNGFSCLVMGIIVRKGLFVKKNKKRRSDVVSVVMIKLFIRPPDTCICIYYNGSNAKRKVSGSNF